MSFTGIKMPLRDEQGNVIGVMANSLDITELKLTEKALIEAKEQAESANQMKTQFTRNMEHDLRTPFNRLWTLSTLLCDQEVEPSKKQMLNMIASSSKELLDYCVGVLEFSYIDHGSVPVLEKNSF